MTELTDIVNQFTNLAQQENEEMFQQGILLAEAVAAGFKAADVKRECGIATGKTARTMANRLAVGMVYGKNFYVDRDWSLHLATIQLSTVDLAKPDTYQAAHDLMTLALMGDDDGRILTAKTLRERVAPKPVNPKPVTVANLYAKREALADIQHEIWSHWMRWVFKICPLNEDGSVTIPAASVERWTRQVAAPYNELTEKEKDSDREQADKVLSVLIPRSQPLPESTADGSDTTKAVA